MSKPVTVKPISLEEEYAKKIGVTPKDVSKLRDWLDTQPHLPGDLITDLDLILTYHCCQRSAEVSKQVLDLHYTLKTLFDNFFKDRVVDQKVLNTLLVAGCVALPQRSHNGSAVLYCVLGDLDPKKFIFHECIRAVLMVLELWQAEEGTWPGFTLVFDMNGFTLQHLAKLDLLSIQQFLYYLQEAMLVNLTSVHFMNAPAFMDRLMMLLRPFMQKKLLESLFVHQAGGGSLEKHLPVDALPQEAGGKYVSVRKVIDDVRERLTLNKDFFVQETKKRVVESKRPGKPKTITDIFGSIEGSFKKLDID